MKLELRPVIRDVARAFVDLQHRHNDPPEGWLFGCGLWRGDELVSVAMAGRPGARAYQDGVTFEVTRVCTLGQRNACSRLYGAIVRAGAALGYRRAFTYTLQSEPGTSLRAAGWTLDAELPARPSERKARYVTDLFGTPTRPEEAKLRWVIYLDERGSRVKGNDHG
jgi:hypothetical protein